ncbi:hypothetical protein [Stakelama saccharophila]|uniref:Uncharacterized protein n=1 Tax=Stakelama saccharophila TaxID=3075605 RepID=A0ABZ0B938_9SPHN|nr:hypothetical protein [Stakelama sp. W311]WNO53932.1 hypothetical protein RPR59_01340 [Stakelama sp. W311]
MAKALAQFAITSIGDEYVLHIEDEDGEIIELTATDEQIEMISDSIAEVYELDEEEDTLGIDDEDDLDED